MDSSGRRFYGTVGFFTVAVALLLAGLWMGGYVALGTVLSTVLGGILAAGAGLVVTEYERQKRRENRWEDWHRRMYRQAARLYAPTHLALTASDVRSAHISRLRSVVDTLRTLIGQAPPEADARILDAAENAITHIYRVEYYANDLDDGKNYGESFNDISSAQDDLWDRALIMMFLTKDEFESADKQEFEKEALEHVQELLKEQEEEERDEQEQMREQITEKGNE